MAGLVTAPGMSGTITWQHHDAPTRPGAQRRDCDFCDLALVTTGDIHRIVTSRVLARHWHTHTPFELAIAHAGHPVGCACRICVLSRILRAKWQ